MFQEVTDLRTQIASYNEALNNSKMLENERDKLTNKYNSFDPLNLEKLQKLLPDSVDNIRLILEIEKLALPYGMVLKDVKYSPVTAAKTKDTTTAQAGTPAGAQKGYGAWDLEFSTQGTYFNFINFIKDLENNLRIVDVASIDFSSDVAPGISPTSNTNTNTNPVIAAEAYKYNIKIKTYWLKN